MLAPPIARTVQAKGTRPKMFSSGNAISNPQTTPNNMAPSMMIRKRKDTKLNMGLITISMTPKTPATIRKVCQDPSKETPGTNFVATQSPPIPATRERIIV